MFKNNLLIRWATAIILIMHSIPGMFNNGVNDFGNLYLNQIGFAPVGLYLAWTIKLSHVAAAILLILNRYLQWAVWPTVAILLVGIFMVHLPNGWFVVGGGYNGIEYNVLLIAVLIQIYLSRQTSSNPEY
ncbi:MAG: DoxX family protein [Saprospiraceae bacterium]|jgi:putative oxidoreductase|nr:DoxX family protein [Saprospiraceae bacterium]HMT69081.1 DoxX family protein [Saprospiraceae bacterium]